MRDDLAFWAAIQARPEDSLPVLIYCDYLDELGDPLGKTLRACADAGTRPGVFPGGGAFWTTTTTHPISRHGVRRGRKTEYVPIRPQPSWLAGWFCRFLAGAASAPCLFHHGIVYGYPDVRDAYLDLDRVCGELRRQLIDPKTGRSRFSGLTHSHWRNESLRVIAVTLAALPKGTDREAERRALSEAYPFGPKKNHPYKIWLQEVRRVVGGPEAKALPPGTCDWCAGKGCCACASKRLREEVAHS